MYVYTYTCFYTCVHAYTGKNLYMYTYIRVFSSGVAANRSRGIELWHDAAGTISHKSDLQ